MQYMFKYLCLLVCLTKCMHKLKFKACKKSYFLPFTVDKICTTVTYLKDSGGCTNTSLDCRR